MPYLGSTVFIAAIACLVLLTLLGSILLASACFGRFVERAAAAAGDRPLQSLAIGAPLLAATLLVAAALLRGAPPAKLLGAVAALALSGACIVGLAGVALRVGSSTSAGSPVSSVHRRVLRGAAIVELAAMLPVFGWFVVLPLSLAIGLGASTATLLSRSRRAVVSPPASVALAATGAHAWPHSAAHQPASEAYATRG